VTRQICLNLLPDSITADAKAWIVSDPLLKIGQNEAVTRVFGSHDAKCLSKKNSLGGCMRLTCPNCGAQYEVDESAIPQGGRDVQCSNCGHTWFQRAAGKNSVSEEELDDATAEEAPDDLSATADEDHQPEVAENVEPSTDEADTPDTEAEAEAENDQADKVAPQDDDAGEPEDKGHKPRELDTGVAAILREEAEREVAERATEAGPLETQTDMGLEEGDETQAVKDRMARLRGQDADDEAGLSPENLAALAAGAGAARKDLLPDIEEINSTLTASSDRDGGVDTEESQERRQRSGFRLGFGVMLIIFALLALLYSYAPQIVDAYPKAAPWMNTYVDLVNQLRMAVDGAMKWAIEKLTSLLAQLTGEETGN